MTQVIMPSVIICNLDASKTQDIKWAHETSNRNNCGVCISTTIEVFDRCIVYKYGHFLVDIMCKEYTLEIGNVCIRKLVQPLLLSSLLDTIELHTKCRSVILTYVIYPDAIMKHIRTHNAILFYGDYTIFAGRMRNDYDGMFVVIDFNDELTSKANINDRNEALMYTRINSCCAHKKNITTNIIDILVNAKVNIDISCINVWLKQSGMRALCRC